MNRWVLFIHVLSAFIFALAHGASTKVILRIQREKSAERLAALLELTTEYANVFYSSLLVMILAGIANGFLGHWWGSIWIWLGLGLLLGIFYAMFALASMPLAKLRKALGLPYVEAGKPHPAEAPASPEDIARLLAAIKPKSIAVIGYGGLALVVWLMVLKPF
jgi:hypothetical protein